jgi:uncharacterized membrane protein YraQ (UPF0718 family)
MYSNYYHILQIPETAKVQEIKSAYRRLAKKFHPDLNKSPGAQEHFILVNEAYEFLIRIYTAQARPVNHSRSQPTKEQAYKQWVDHERAKARARAAREAKKKFEQFKKSPIYKTTQIIYHYYDLFSIGIGIMIIIASIAGLFVDFRSEKGIQSNHVIASVFLTFLGILFIVFSVSSIKNRNYNKKI